MRRRRVPGVALAAGALLVAGCGGSDGSGPGPNPSGALAVRAGGNNVPDRFSSDLWVHRSWAYSGTWGAPTQARQRGNAIKIWSLDGSGAPTLADSIVIPGISTVSDLQVSEDGAVLVASTEGGGNNGLFVYGLASPQSPVLLDSALVSQGIHTATIADLGGKRYVFAARDPADPALLVYEITDPSAIVLRTTVPIPPNYGIHDTFVRDGIAFVFAWNTGVIIYDVGGAGAGGSPEAPVELSRLVTATDGVSGGAQVHNGWWFHNPATGERRYLFIGQEGAGVVGAASSGDLHVVDVADLTHPQEVATFHLAGAGTHNFWVDEERQILYLAYYNGGVVALDVSGTLAGDLSSRLISQIQPGGAGNTYTWGVQLSGGSLYAIDMLSGLWQLSVP
ncbi:MAG TPA: hypothetical protein VHR43_17985 [Gemmatimonadales bacterium]|nr:hypothetical protein [Gemmatimonadales bacterium]